jgi:hypothetical protein
MVTLDHRLLYTARRLFNGANVHRLKEMIFAYEQAVDLHNHKRESHRKYQRQHERRLRCYVAIQRSMALKSACKAARERAASLMAQSASLHERSEALEREYEEWLRCLVL